ncbi:polysaccharide deacetylase family protein [Desemzia sp. RIT804]|uniref:polysaccharide deacetylase family protein n=1 Tax=Desemzia sp. RIT 804 TaxID=2810209 RepID=UPI00194F1E57|nr:polysaccharide deacetylase family protein [Desemzia sp. RIT 804]MBM6615195.1 polysaccharide deacetylase family protein [Desemzia sp. RIT 804]
MGFSTLCYHEFRKRKEITEKSPSPIKVAQEYEDALPRELFTYIEDFEEQMNYLKEEKYHVLSFEEVRAYFEGAEIQEKSVLLTFDDTYQSFKEYAYPILKKYQFPIVSFVVLGWLSEKEEPFLPERSVSMSKAELESMNDLLTTANHTTMLHQRFADFTTAIQTVTDEELKKDLDACGAYVDEPNVFAYPFGIYNQNDVLRLKEIGMEFAFTCEPGVNTQETPVLELHRSVVPLGISLSKFKELLV